MRTVGRFFRLFLDYSLWANRNSRHLRDDILENTNRLEVGFGNISGEVSPTDQSSETRSWFLTANFITMIWETIHVTQEGCNEQYVFRNKVQYTTETKIYNNTLELLKIN